MKSIGMTLIDYQELAMRTAKDMGSFEKNFLHVALGLTSAAGEFADCVKKSIIYEKKLDKDNAIEELGDTLWFLTLGARTLGITLEDVARYNIDKLKKRYPNGYNDIDAIMRWDKVKTPKSYLPPQSIDFEEDEVLGDKIDNLHQSEDNKDNNTGSEQSYSTGKEETENLEEIILDTNLYLVPAKRTT